MVWTQVFLQGKDCLLIIFNISKKDQLNPPLSRGAFLVTGNSSHSSQLMSGSLSQQMLSTSEGSKLERAYLTITMVCGHALHFKYWFGRQGLNLFSPCIWNNKITPFQMNDLKVQSLDIVHGECPISDRLKCLRMSSSFFPLSGIEKSPDAYIRICKQKRTQFSIIF